MWRKGEGPSSAAPIQSVGRHLSESPLLWYLSLQGFKRAPYTSVTQAADIAERGGTGRSVSDWDSWHHRLRIDIHLALSASVQQQEAVAMADQTESTQMFTPQDLYVRSSPAVREAARKMTEPREWHDTAAANNMMRTFVNDYYHQRRPSRPVGRAGRHVIENKVGQRALSWSSGSLDETSMTETQAEGSCQEEVVSAEGLVGAAGPVTHNASSRQSLQKLGLFQDTSIPKVSRKNLQFPESHMPQIRRSSLSKSLDSVYFSGHYEERLERVKIRLLGSTLKHESPRLRSKYGRSFSEDKGKAAIERNEKATLQKYKELRLPRHKAQEDSDRHFRETYHVKQQSLLQLNVGKLQALRNKRSARHSDLYTYVITPAIRQNHVLQRSVEKIGRSGAPCSALHEKSQLETTGTTAVETRPEDKRDLLLSAESTDPEGNKLLGGLGQRHRHLANPSSNLQDSSPLPTATLVVNTQTLQLGKVSVAGNSLPSAGLDFPNSGSPDKVPGEVLPKRPDHTVMTRGSNSSAGQRQKSAVTVVNLSLSESQPSAATPPEGYTHFPRADAASRSVSTTSSIATKPGSRTSGFSKASSEDLRSRSYLKKFKKVEVFGEKINQQKHRDNKDSIGIDLEQSECPSAFRPPVYKIDTTNTLATSTKDWPPPEMSPPQRDTSSRIAAVTLGEKVGERALKSYKPKLEPRKSPRKRPAPQKLQPDMALGNPELACGPDDKHVQERKE